MKKTKPCSVRARARAHDKGISAMAEYIARCPEATSPRPRRRARKG